METVWRLLQNLKIEILYSPAILFLGNFLKKTKAQTQEDTHTPVFLAVLFTIAKIWKQPKCPSKGEWTKNMCVCMCMYIHTYIHTQWNIIWSLKRIKSCHLWQYGWTCRVLCYMKRQTKKDKYHMVSLRCTIQKVKQMEKDNQTETDSQIQKTNKWLPEEREMGRWMK